MIGLWLLRFLFFNDMQQTFWNIRSKELIRRASQHYKAAGECTTISIAFFFFTLTIGNHKWIINLVCILSSQTFVDFLVCLLTVIKKIIKALQSSGLPDLNPASNSQAWIINRASNAPPTGQHEELHFDINRIPKSAILVKIRLDIYCTQT